MHEILIAIGVIALILTAIFLPVIIHLVQEHRYRPLSMQEKLWYLARMEGLDPDDPKVKDKLLEIRFGMRQRRKWPDLNKLTWKERRLRERFILNNSLP